MYDKCALSELVFGGDYRLITQVLRDERGFNGAVLTDYFNGGYMNADQFLRVGAEPFAYYYLILIAVGVIAAGLTAWGVTAIVLRWKKEKQLEE